MAWILALEHYNLLWRALSGPDLQLKCVFLRMQIHASVCCVHMRLYPEHGQICIFKRAEALLIDPQRSNMYYREMSFPEYSSSCWSFNFYHAGRLQCVLLHFAQSVHEKHQYLYRFPFLQRCCL